MTISIQFCAASTRAIIFASLARMTAWEFRGLPKTILWFDHFKHSSTTRLCAARLVPHIIHRSWLKLLRITLRPLFTGPSVLATGTRTLLKVTYAVPAVDEYAVLIAFVSMLSSRGTKTTVSPFCVPVSRARLTFNHTTYVRLAAHREVVGEHAIRDPSTAISTC